MKLIKSGCTRFGKRAIRNEIKKDLEEMPSGYYYEYRLEALTKKEYLARESENRHIKEN